MDPLIRLRGLRYSYPDGTRALNGVDLEVYTGDSLGIIGANGSGKSTLLLHLNGILRGTGSVEIAGLEPTEKNIPLIRSKVGLVFQDPEDQLFMPTVFDDVAFGPINMGMQKEKVLYAVKHALLKVNLGSFEERSSHHLSVGEKRRASIATVLSMNPEALVLDEPSSSLDPRHRHELIKLINGLALTKIVAAHDLDFVRQTCSRAAIMHKGRIAAQGPAPEILSDERLLQDYQVLFPSG